MDSDPDPDETSGLSQASQAFEERDFARDTELQEPYPRVRSPTPVHLAAGIQASLDTNFPLGGGNTSHHVKSPSVQSSWSAASDRQPGHGGHDPSDRVFPIRSVISVDPPKLSSADQEYFSRLSSDNYGTSRPVTHHHDTTMNPKRRPASITSDSAHSVGSSVRSPGPRDFRQDTRRGHAAGARSTVQADAERHVSRPLPLFVDNQSDDEGSEASGDMPTSQPPGSTGRGSDSPTGNTLDSHMTTRFKHVTTDDGHLVITGRDGTLQRCEDEPIHTPGAIQAFGLMLAIREEPDGRFTVRYASENSKRFIGYSPLDLFRLHNFTDILTDEQADNLLDHIDFIRDEDADPSINGPEVFSMSVMQPKKRATKLWCAIHIHTAHPELIICEFELDDDPEFPLRPEDENTPDIPEDTLHSNPTMEELAESTEMTSKPLRVLRSARKRKGEAGAMQVFDIMSQVQEQLASAPNLERFLKVLVGIIKELTGFHRVMVYQVSWP